MEVTRDLVEVVRCKDCGYYQGEEPNRYCMGLPTEPAVCREPDDFCSRGRRGNSNNKHKKDYPDFIGRHSDVFYERLVKWLKGEIEVHGQERLTYEVGLSMFDFKTRKEAIEYFMRYVDDGK